MGKIVSNKYGQKLLDSVKTSTTDAIKTVSKIAIQKTAEATVDLIGKKIADKISVLKKPSNNNNSNNEDVEITDNKKRYISPEERQQVINELRLVPKKMHIFKNYWWIKVNFKKDTYPSKKGNKLFIN